MDLVERFMYRANHMKSHESYLSTENCAAEEYEMNWGLAEILQNCWYVYKPTRSSLELLLLTNNKRVSFKGRE